MKKLIIALSLVMAGWGNLNAQNMETKVPKISTFPTGDENVRFEKYFTGKSWLAPLTTLKDLNVPIFNVTFEPGCRNNWHTHTGGQILIAVGGVGYYQERGKAARRLLPGEVVEITPNIEHWHGAAPDSWFSHLAIECNPQANRNTWLERVDDEEYQKAVNTFLPSLGQQMPASKSEDIMNRIELCKKNYTQLFGGEALTGEGTDPELMNILQKYIFGEVFHTGDLDMKMRELITCVSLATMQQLPQLKAHAGAALNIGVTPVELREAIYQCAPLIGFPKVLNALGALNATFTERGIKLPLERQATITEDDRYEKGYAIQNPLYGDRIKEAMKELPAEMGTEVARFLTEVYFGDFYTRNGLDLKTRELLSFCVLTILEAEDPLLSHLQANLKVGNSKEMLVAAVIQCMPYIGFPAALKTLKIIKTICHPER